MRAWLEEKNKPPVRPFFMAVINQSTKALLKADTFSRLPDSKNVHKFLLQAMAAPAKEASEDPHRPLMIITERSELADALNQSLAGLGISAQQGELPKPIMRRVNHVISEYEADLRGHWPEPPALLSVPGLTKQLVASLFKAAADFYRSAPWQFLADDQPLALTIDPPGKQAFAILMGNAGLEYGLLLYESWEELERTFRYASDPLEHIPPEGWRSISFEPPDGLPFADLDAIEEHGWEIAGERAYPFPATYTHESLVRPSRAELLLYDAAMRAIPIFVRQHLKKDRSGDFQLTEATIDVVCFEGRKQVKIRYPAGKLPETTEALTAESPELSRLKFQTGESQQDSEDLSEYIFQDALIEPPASPRRKAQLLMFKAWEEPNANRRLSLAREALEEYPDCADAYILLAEEDSETVEEALVAYQKGVDAAVRSLGNSLLDVRTGKLWNVRETRAYMRARQGLTECLVELGRLEAALENLQDMLRLDPDDHQGVRYDYLALLMRMQRFEEVQKLLDEYAEDGYAGWPYTRALLEFRRAGATEKADQSLAKALLANKHVPDYLTGKKTIPGEALPYSGFGDKNEAIIYSSAHFSNWWQTPGAIDWLKEHLPKKKSKPS